MKEHEVNELEEAEQIRCELEKYIDLYNSLHPEEKIDPGNVFVNRYVNKIGSIGCRFEDDGWYIYEVDDRFNLLTNGPFSKNGALKALTTMLYMPSEITKLRFTEDELRLFLRGPRPKN